MSVNSTSIIGPRSDLIGIPKSPVARIEDALLNSFPVENVLRPAVTGAGTMPEHGLHTKGVTPDR